MGQSLVYKILQQHLVDGSLTPGAEIGIRIDQTLTQDATGTMAYLQFEAMNIPRVKTDLSVSYVDHNTLQEGFENADDHRYLATVAAKYGIHYSRPGNGICHQVHLERFGVPGKTLLGSDSHTPTGGGIGMIAIGAGGLDVAVAMGGGPFYLTAPQVVNVRLTGQLPDWVAAKDVILKVLSILTTKGNVGKVLEYSGPGVATLSVPERATITNMGAELGVTTSVFPSDERTREFLDAQGRGAAWRALAADSGAEYARVIDIDLSTLEPMVAKPHSPDNIDTVRNCAGTKVHQVCIGSCTNSSYKDLVTVASILAGRTASPDTSLVVSPGSRQVFQMIARDGYLTELIAAGARIVESACGFCIGAGQAPPSGGVSVRTNNRNFEGRSGTRDAQIYLTSPETAAAAAITGVLTDPRDLAKLGIACPKVAMPAAFLVDDRGVLPPAGDSQSVQVQRGPNIGAPPASNPLADRLLGDVMIKVGDKITTDHISPAGSRLKFRSNVEKYSTFVFEILDPTFPKRCGENRDKGRANFIIAGDSYGQGSSREHAAMCPLFLGVRALLAKSIERIHHANLINFGILPLTFANPADYDRIAAADALELVDLHKQIASADALTVRDVTKGFEFKVALKLSARQRKILLAGGLLNFTRSRGA
ncbi:MAG: aconitate hydratase [Phycisphaerae bacterium]|nr:aconitate hydratase [Phycisphaerae bacterium]